MSSDFNRKITAFGIFAILFFGSFTFAIPGIIPQAFAATITWDGGGDGINWSDPLNWDSDTLPTGNDDIILLNTGVVNLDIDFSLSSAGTFEISDAQQSLADGDALRGSGDFKDAANKYKDALAKAESALP